MLLPDPETKSPGAFEGDPVTGNASWLLDFSEVGFPTFNWLVLDLSFLEKEI